MKQDVKFTRRTLLRFTAAAGMFAVLSMVPSVYSAEAPSVDAAKKSECKSDDCPDVQLMPGGRATYDSTNDILTFIEDNLTIHFEKHNSKAANHPINTGKGFFIFYDGLSYSAMPDMNISVFKDGNRIFEKAGANFIAKSTGELPDNLILSFGDVSFDFGKYIVTMKRKDSQTTAKQLFFNSNDNTFIKE